MCLFVQNKTISCYFLILLFSISTKQFHLKLVLRQYIVAYQFQTQEAKAGLPLFTASVVYSIRPCLKITETKGRLQLRRESICPQCCTRPPGTAVHEMSRHLGSSTKGPGVQGHL